MKVFAGVIFSQVLVIFFRKPMFQFIKWPNLCFKFSNYLKNCASTYILHLLVMLLGI